MRSSFNLPPATNVPDTAPELIGKEELRRRLNLRSIRMVEELMRKRKIPYIRPGHWTVRFSWAKVLAAIAVLEHRAIHG
jgi:hypothetical protein